MNNITLQANDDEYIESIESRFVDEDIYKLAIKFREFALAMGYSQETVDKIIANPYDGMSLLSAVELQALNIEDLILEYVNKLRN